MSQASDTFSKISPDFSRKSEKREPPRDTSTKFNDYADASKEQDGPRKKGDFRFGDKAQDEKALYTEALQPRVKRLPFRRYMLASGLLFVVIVQGVLWLSMVQPRHNPFAQPAELLSLDWWLAPLETNAPMRLAMIDTEWSIQQINALSEQRLGATFADPTAAEASFSVVIDTAGNVRAADPADTVMPASGTAMDVAKEMPASSFLGAYPEPVEAITLNFAQQPSQLLREDAQKLQTLLSDMHSLQGERGDTAWLWQLRLRPNSIAARDNNKGYNPYLEQVQALLKKAGVPAMQISVGDPLPAGLQSKQPQQQAQQQQQIQQQASGFASQGATLARASVTVEFSPVVDFAARATAVSESVENAESVAPTTSNSQSATIAWRDRQRRVSFFYANAGGVEWRAAPDGIIQVREADGQWRTVVATRALLEAYYSQGRGELAGWQDRRAGMYPPPLSLALSLVLGGWAMALMLIPPRLPSDTSGGISDFFVSDAPIAMARNDHLNFMPIARSLSQFLRNAHTSPPLTIAITGQWGCGKSSLMNLLRNDLQQHRIRPVWVNAWHHQNESQFLAGLLEGIRRECLPPIFSSANLIFQTNLFWLRLRGSPLRNALALVLLLVPLGYWMTTGAPILPDEPSMDTLQTSAWQASPLLSALISCVMLVQLVGSRLNSLTGSSWFQKLVGAKRKPLDLRSMVGLREQFVEEFQQLCEALKPTTLTIFIDDLDRCHQTRILDILETVNFLVSSGNCVVVLGMEREPVEKAVANYFQATHKDMDQAALLTKARRYMEKLINIEVPVPQTDATLVEKLTREDGAGRSASKSRMEMFSVRVLLLMASILICLCAGIWLGKQVHRDEVAVLAGNAGEAQMEGVAAGSPADAEGPLEGPLNVGQPGDGKDASNEAHAAQLAQAVEASTVQVPGVRAPRSPKAQSLWLWGPVLGIVAILGLLVFERFRQRQRVVEQDSEEFTDGIVTWGRLVGDTRPTPRRIKRFINRARFLAMRAGNSEFPIKEEAIVTLAGLYEIRPELFHSSEIYDGKAIISELNKTCNSERLNGVRDSVNVYCHGGHAQQIRQFLQWVDGASFHS